MQVHGRCSNNVVVNLSKWLKNLQQVLAESYYCIFSARHIQDLDDDDSSSRSFYPMAAYEHKRLRRSSLGGVAAADELDRSPTMSG